MRRFFAKLTIFSIPFILIFGTVSIVDPFQRLDLLDIFNTNIKKIASAINTPLWKIIKYQKNPVSNIILGDSRALKMSPEYLEKVTGEKFYNFAFGAATIEEMCSVFWLAAKSGNLKSASFSVNLNSFNLNHSRNRVPGASETAEKFLMYLTNRDVIKSSYLILLSSLTKKKINIGRPNKSREKFWRHILEVAIPRFYMNFQFDNSKLEKLKEISVYCRKNDTKLIFIVPFTHIDAIEQMNLYVSQKDKSRMRSELASLSTVYDFNYPNEITRDDGCFLDPNHSKKEISDLMIDEIWGGEARYAKILGAQSF